MPGTRTPKQGSPSLLPLAAESREELRGRLARRYAFGVAFFAFVLGYVGYQLTPGEALGVPYDVQRHGAIAFGTSIFTATILLGLLVFRRRFAELERIRNLQAQLTIYRVSETLDRLDHEDELVRCALGVIAEGTGLAHWAMYRRDERSGVLQLTATRGLPESAKTELEPGPVGPEATSPAARAAWLLEAIVVRDPGSAPDYAFAGAPDGPGAHPIVVSVPLTDQGQAVGVLQCFVPRRRGLDPDQLALVRWTASQLGVGLKRLRMERRDRMLASYLRSSAELVLVLDERGVVFHANEAAERALGAAPGGLRGRRAAEFAFEETTGRPFTSRDALREGASEQWPLRLQRADGKSFPCDVTVAAIVHPETGDPARLLVGRDVTERREREEALHNQAEELRELNAQLQDMNVRLGTSQSSQQQFLASTSHELRTPLNGVIGFATLLQQGAAVSEEEARGFAQAIRESAEHLLAVLNDILDLAKMESGRVELALDVGDIAPLLRAAVESLRPVADGKGLSLRVDVPDRALPIAHDAGRLRQVILNVVGNALKFTDEGEVSVRARRRAEDVCVEIADTGIGIPRDQQPRLFTKFAKIGGSYAGRRPGTGLGLAISRELVQRMGGSITAESDGENRGTRVRLVFPLAESESSDAAAMTAEREA